MRTFGALASTLLAVLSSTTGLVGATLTDDDLRNIPSPGGDFDIKNGKLLAPILIPRVPGTEGQVKTQNHFHDFFATELPEWKLSWQNSTSKTPATGDRDIPFANMVYRRDPPWAQPGDVARLTLVAHYDSKLEPEGFIAATDSAAPCAMLMHTARTINKALDAKWKAMEESGDAELDTPVGVQILFLDGEEAFVAWTEEDSLYGSRSIADEWEKEFHPAMSTFRTQLSSISLFVLLDLLGAPNPSIPSYFLTTHWAYKKMAALEKRMRDLDLLEGKVETPFLPDMNKKSEQFRPFFGMGRVEDDHIPFMERGVDVLHLIANPFPDVWHTMDDDGEHLDLSVSRDWAKIVTAFTMDWMELSGLLPDAPKQKEKRSKGMKGEL